jgi:hypothetical protein
MPHPGRYKVAALHQTVLQGGAIGAGAGVALAQYLSGDASMVAFGAALGVCTGLVCGLLTWLSTAELPQAPIPPVRAPTRAPITPRRGVRDGAGGHRARRRPG